ncbi:transcriptional regulator [Streptomyces sp. 7R007]
MTAPSRGPVCRVRALLLHPVSKTLTVDEHVRVALPAPAAPLGDVLVGRGTDAAGAIETACAHPGALVVAVHDGPRCWLRFAPDGTVVALRVRGDQGPRLWPVLASLAHAWLVAGLPAGEFGAAASYALGLHSPPSSRPSRRRAASASSEPARPTEA